VKDTISSHKLCRYILSVRPYLTALATQDCCRAFGSSTMVDPFLLRAREAFPCNLFSLILLWSVTLTGTRLPPLQFAAKRPKFFVLCRCCTLCTASRENFTSHRFQLCWLLPTLHLSYWQMICASLDKSRDLQLPFFSPFTALATQDCYRLLFGSSTMVNPFVLRAGWCFRYTLFLSLVLMSCIPCWMQGYLLFK
jgi:hypothetical protein